MAVIISARRKLAEKAMSAAHADAVEAADGLPEYQGLEILSPMVRGSTLPLRLCALHYGAGLVYSSMTVDQGILEADRVEVGDAEAGIRVVDYISRKHRKSVFSTCAEERRHVIFQLGTCDAAMATQAALHVCRDVRGVDVNMGCTAHFSTSGGMGAELLDKPELAADILKALRRELPPDSAVSCKIRLQSTLSRTRDFMQLCERSGATAIAVHLRTAEEDRKAAPARWADIAELCSAVRIPVIANGDFLSRQRIGEFWQQQESAFAGPSAIMIARGALWNPAIFSREEVGFDEMVQRYASTAERVENTFSNTKWVLREMFNPGGGEGRKQPRFGGLQGKEFRQFKHSLALAENTAELRSLLGTPGATAATVLG